MIPLIRPYINYDEVEESFRDIFTSGTLTGGKYVHEFEDLFAEYIGVDYAFTTTSATTALHLSLVAGGIQPGDEVLVSDFTFPASGNVIIQAGATPVLLDCKKNSYLLDVDKIESKITKKTKAIMPVDPFGIPSDMDTIQKIAEKYGLMIVEDAACAVGSKRDDRLCGSWSGTGCFSFHPRKLITTGEGGMITTNDEKIAEKIRVLRNHGGVKSDYFLSFKETGFNYRMSELSAAVGVTQMKKIEEILQDRMKTAKLYSDRLNQIPEVIIPDEYAHTGLNYQSYVVMLDGKVSRNKVIQKMRENGIETTLGTYAMHAQKSFAKYGYKPGDLPNSYNSQNQSLTLPLIPSMSNKDIAYVVKKLQECVT